MSANLQTLTKWNMKEEVVKLADYDKRTKILQVSILRVCCASWNKSEVIDLLEVVTDKEWSKEASVQISPLDCFLIAR